ncbi:MAG: aspartyl protease family protein [Pseudomonadota bacterium]
MARAYLSLALRSNPFPMRQRGSLRSHLLILLLGGALGIAGMWWSASLGLWVPDPTALPAEGVARAGSPTTRENPAARLGRLPSVLEVTVSYADSAPARLPAITVALNNGRLAVVMALPALIDATKVLVPLGRGRALRLREVLAVAPEAQLVVLAADDPQANISLAGLNPSAEPGAGLHLGRPLSLLGLGDAREAAYVDSSAQRSTLGGYWYALSPAASAVGVPAAIVDERGDLIGIAVHSPVDDAAPGARAGLDLQALRALLAPDPTQAIALETFVGSFFDRDDIGRLLSVERAARASDWQAVIAAGSELMYLSYPIADRVRPLLEEAFQVRIADALARPGGARLAENALGQAADLLGWSASRRVLAARVARAQGDVATALGQLNSAQQEAQGDLQTQSSLREAARRLLSDLLAGGQVNAAQGEALLRGQLKWDPDHAHYHADLGRLLFEQGRYRDALLALYRARALDGARYGKEFASLIALAEERLYAPSVTVVPVFNQGATLFVNGTIPGTSGTYRFILDTGASITAISPRVAAQLPGLVSRGTVRLTTANGEVDAPLVTLPTLDVAGARVAQLDVVVLDSLASYDGLLGLSFLDHFNMELDRNRNEMTLRLR